MKIIFTFGFLSTRTCAEFMFRAGKKGKKMKYRLCITDFQAGVAFCILACLLVWPHSVFSQSGTDTLSSRPAETRYFEKMDTVISVRLNLNNEHERFVLNGDDFRYDIRPNIILGNRISVNYRIFSLGVGFKLNFIPGNKGNSLQGKTKAFFLRMNIFTRHWLQELQFGRVTGFYLYNSGDYITGWTRGTDPYIQFPGLRVIAVLGATSYKFNPRFSVKALTSQTEIQLKSCGSLIPSVAYSYYLTEDLANDSSGQYSSRYDAVLNLGYYYTFVISSRIYISLGFAPGCGASYTHLVTKLPEGKVYTDFFSPVFRLQERAGIGYNSRKFFGGFDLSMVQSVRDDNSTAVQMNASRIYFQFFAGYRFTAPSFLKKKEQQVEDLLPVMPGKK